MRSGGTLSLGGVPVKAMKMFGGRAIGGGGVFENDCVVAVAVIACLLFFPQGLRQEIVSGKLRSSLCLAVQALACIPGPRYQCSMLLVECRCCHRDGGNCGGVYGEKRKETRSAKPSCYNAGCTWWWGGEVVVRYLAQYSLSLKTS